MSLLFFNDLTTQLIIVVTIFIIIWYLLLHFKKSYNLPPGPWSFPFIGYNLGKKPHVTVANLKKKYGDLIRINIGTEHAIFLTSFKAIKESLFKQADTFAGRRLTLIPVLMKDAAGIVRGSGEIWSEIRRFSLSKLRNFGFGKSSLEPQIKDEIQYFLQEIRSFKNQLIPNIGQLLQKSVINVISIIVTAKRFDYNDKLFNELLNLFNENLKQAKINDRAVSFIPHFLRFNILLKVLGIKSNAQSCAASLQLIFKIVNNVKDKYQADNPSNFIDTWLSESKKNSNQAKLLTKNQLSAVVFDLFLAGSDTSTIALGWSLLYMIEHPDIQAKAQKEIDDVIGRDRTPSMSDQKLMPYTEAILMEVNRIVTIVPLAVVHCTLADTMLMGKFIAKGTSIVPNLWAVHHDPENFPEPEKFKPERFLTENGQINKIKEFIPFSMGKRQCMGESLAKMELFLYFSSMLQQFTFKKVNKTVDFDYDYAVISFPKAQPICAIPR